MIAAKLTRAMAFGRVYTDEQRTAIQQAYADRKLPPKRIVALAGEGALTCDGELIDAFQLNESSAADIGRRYVQKLAGVRESTLADAAPRDAIEQLRRRLVSAVDASLMQVELGMARRRKAADGEDLRKLARAVREIAAIPEPGAGAPAATKPGATRDGRKADGATRGGVAGSVLAAAAAGTRRGFEAAQDTPELSSDDRSASVGVADGDDGERGIERGIEVASDDPGQYVRGQIAALSADAVRIAT